MLEVQLGVVKTSLENWRFALRNEAVALSDGIRVEGASKVSRRRLHLLFLLAIVVSVEEETFGYDRLLDHLDAVICSLILGRRGMFRTTLITHGTLLASSPLARRVHAVSW